jgi:RNA polymerase sigma-70 factor (ECF subfamily)
MVATAGTALELDFSGLVSAHQPGLISLARRLVWDSEEARDIVQGALAEAWAQRAHLKSPDAAGAWLRRILVNRAISVLRRRRLWRVMGALLFVEPELAAAPDEAVERSQHLRALSRALETLSARQAAAFTLRYLEGLPLDEVAAALGCGRGTARVHLQRAVAALRAKNVLAETTHET